MDVPYTKTLRPFKGEVCTNNTQSKGGEEKLMAIPISVGAFVAWP